MSGVAVVAIVIAAIFAAGVFLGATSVISLSTIKRGTWRIWDLPHQFRDPRDWRPVPPVPMPRPEPEQDLELLRDSECLDGSPTWPDSGYRI